MTLFTHRESGLYAENKPNLARVIRDEKDFTGWETSEANQLVVMGANVRKKFTSKALKYGKEVFACKYECIVFKCAFCKRLHQLRLQQRSHFFKLAFDAFVFFTRSWVSKHC